MKVISIKSKTRKIPFNCQAPRAHAGVPEGLKLVMGVAITCWVPTLMLSITYQHPLPLLLTLSCEILGTFTGLLLYALRPAYRIPSCVPVSRTPNVVAIYPRDKRAA